MAVLKRGKLYHLRIRPFAGTPLIGVKTPARTKQEARQIEMAILTACKTGNYSALDPMSREVCLCMFRNQEWELPDGLSGAPERRPTERLTLRKACQLFIQTPKIRESKAVWRYEYCIVHLLETLGVDTPLKSVWVNDLEEYQTKRTNEGAAPATVNWELATLSKIFTVMMKKQLAEKNPVSFTDSLSTASGEREAYIATVDVKKIADRCPAWARPIIWTAYYTGMRRGEILGLTRRQVNLSRRIITLYSDSQMDGSGTKEGHWKRVPVHKDLVPILKDALKIRVFGSDRLFHYHDSEGSYPLGLETFKNPWPRACEALKKANLLREPLPRFHDLRHTWRSNARESGMRIDIEMAIMGHSERKKSVHERYGRISDQELVGAIDSMVFEHGRKTEIHALQKASNKAKNEECVQSVYKPRVYKENQEAAVNLSS